MKIYDLHELVRATAKALGKPILLLSLDPAVEACDYDIEEVLKAVPFLNIFEDSQAVVDGYAFVVCDSDEEMNNLYDHVVGDDGPTKSNPYDGPAKVYALTISAEGEFMNENT
jgi:hypothetical protein